MFILISAQKTLGNEPVVIREKGVFSSEEMTTVPSSGLLLRLHVWAASQQSLRHPAALPAVPQVRGQDEAMA